MRPPAEKKPPNDAKKKEQREKEIKRCFLANAASQLQYAGTEFSTAGASSKYLEEYELEESGSLLGVGGYAEVRWGRHKATGCPVAFKIYDKYKLGDPQVKQNLVREIKVLSRLTGRHANILKLYESIDTYSHVYLVTEYLEGAALSEHLKNHGQLTET